METLTPKQQRIFDFIHSYIEENHMAPSLRDIGDHFKLSVGTVQDQVEALRRKGFLKKEETKARGLRLPFGAGQIPVLGRVHAGVLHTAFENVESYVPVGAARSPAHHFALRVQGDSMIDAGILEGDIVVVRVRADANVGDVVVARVEDETTIKRLARKDGRLVLKPENPNYRIIEDPFELVGVVVELRRTYKN
jgi:repressor LexA